MDKQGKVRIKGHTSGQTIEKLKDPGLPGLIALGRHCSGAKTTALPDNHGGKGNDQLGYKKGASSVYSLRTRS